MINNVSFLLILVLCNQLSIINSFPSIFGIGSVLFRPRSLSIHKISNENEESLVQAAKFFTDAFWPSKTVSNSKSLTKSQTIAVERLQVSEFRRRYKSGRSFTSSRDRKSELVITKMKSKKINDGDLGSIVVGCAGVELDSIPVSSAADRNAKTSPLMSNLAVSRNFRRVGIAEDLIGSVENLVRKEWGYNECYLYVEKANTPAVKLYRKLGYKLVWENEKARSMKLTDFGSLIDSETVLLCMKKNLNRNIFSRLFNS